MKEAKQMLWMVLGVAIGFSLGGYGLLRIFQWRPEIGDNPTLSLFIALPILGGGLVGGGYLAQVLLEKYDRSKRKKTRAKKETDPFRSKKRKKK